MNKSLIAIAIAFASTAAMAQAPQSTAQEANANKSGGVAADKAQAKTDMRKDGTSPMSSPSAMGSGTKMASGSTLSPRMKMMDTNGDGMVSQAEWNAYHSGMWKKMKKTKGMASNADVEAMIVGGPN